MSNRLLTVWTEGVNLPIMQPDQKITLILDAALPVFVRFGFRKTSMADIARAASISRASLYLSFSSKEELFRAGSVRAHAKALDEVAAVLASDGCAFDRIAKAMAVFQRELIAPFGGSADADELFAANVALAADITLDARQKLLNLLTQTILAAAQKGEIDLEPLQVPPAQLANLIVAAMDGIKHAQGGGSSLQDGMKLFMRLLRLAVAAVPLPTPNRIS
ncbi:MULTISPECIES: TetR/AcrR family transcriptional regulator [unclassified Ensifer]|uniref:TetR/AcrR family transcriptional regulator n=1 Tax=unclassified Ensifer TaxID=2633371 RepID=UPI00070B9730|nr:MULTISPECIES: TetR/AcrR family transcriptional regulator [unclassified Ensifer]KRD72611.1 TetR family transcriptional regulator [Ensifer sp. Root278]